MEMKTGLTSASNADGQEASRHVSYRVSYFDQTRHTDEEIARTHLAIRQWQVDVQGVTFSNFYESREELNDIGAFYLRPGGNFFVAEDLEIGKVVGHVGIKNGGENGAILKRMGVLPDYQGRGIGASLAMMALAWTRSQDFSKVTLTTGEIENAKPFYERFGFREIGRILRNHDYVMELDLSAANT